MAINFSKPVVGDTYAGILETVRDNMSAVATMDYTGATNIATGTIRWNSVSQSLQKWNGATWVALSTNFTFGDSITVPNTLYLGSPSKAVTATNIIDVGSNQTITGQKTFENQYVKAPGSAQTKLMRGASDVHTSILSIGTWQLSSAAFRAFSISGLIDTAYIVNVSGALISDSGVPYFMPIWDKTNLRMAAWFEKKQSGYIYIQVDQNSFINGSSDWDSTTQPRGYMVIQHTNSIP